MNKCNCSTEIFQNLVAKVKHYPHQLREDIREAARASEYPGTAIASIARRLQRLIGFGVVDSEMVQALKAIDKASVGWTGEDEEMMGVLTKAKAALSPPVLQRIMKGEGACRNREGLVIVAMPKPIAITSSRQAVGWLAEACYDASSYSTHREQRQDALRPEVERLLALSSGIRTWLEDDASNGVPPWITQRLQDVLEVIDSLQLQYLPPSERPSSLLTLSSCFNGSLDFHNQFMFNSIDSSEGQQKVNAVITRYGLTVLPQLLVDLLIGIDVHYDQIEGKSMNTVLKERGEDYPYWQKRHLFTDSDLMQVTVRVAALAPLLRTDNPSSEAFSEMERDLARLNATPWERMVMTGVHRILDARGVFLRPQ